MPVVAPAHHRTQIGSGARWGCMVGCRRTPSGCQGPSFAEWPSTTCAGEMPAAPMRGGHRSLFRHRRIGRVPLIALSPPPMTVFGEDRSWGHSTRGRYAAVIPAPRHARTVPWRHGGICSRVGYPSRHRCENPITPAMRLSERAGSDGARSRAKRIRERFRSGESCVVRPSTVMDSSYDCRSCRASPPSAEATPWTSYGHVERREGTTDGWEAV
jgi:hypothetical protein